MVIWVGSRYGSPHDVRIKVSQRHGQRMDSGNLAVVALRPQRHVVAGHPSAVDLRAVGECIALNEAAILDHWNELIDGTELGQRLHRLPSQPSLSPPALITASSALAGENRARVTYLDWDRYHYNARQGRLPRGGPDRRPMRLVRPEPHQNELALRQATRDGAALGPRPTQRATPVKFRP